jgi:sulfate transport system permease protein
VAILLCGTASPAGGCSNALVDLPIAVSPVVVGLALILVYGKFEPIGRWLDDHGIQIIFAIARHGARDDLRLAAARRAREVAPVLEEIGDEQEQAAWTLGATALADVLADHAAGDPLGTRLRRRADDSPAALGEYGAVAVVSGNLEGRPRPLTLFVQEHFENFDGQAPTRHLVRARGDRRVTLI